MEAPLKRLYRKGGEHPCRKRKKGKKDGNWPSRKQGMKTRNGEPGSMPKRRASLFRGSVAEGKGLKKWAMKNGDLISAKKLFGLRGKKNEKERYFSFGEVWKRGKTRRRGIGKT